MVGAAEEKVLVVVRPALAYALEEPAPGEKTNQNSTSSTKTKHEVEVA